MKQLISLAVYRLFFHPLSKIPGPFLQRISHLPRILQCRDGDRHLQEMASHERYGCVLRIAPNAITFNTLTALQTIHAKDSNVFKGDEFYGLLDGGAEGGRSIMMTEKASDHAARRRVLDKALPPREQAFRMLNDMAKLFAFTAFMQAGGKPKGWSKSVDISLIATWYSFDLITATAFGQSLNMLRNEEYRWAPGCLRTASIFLYWGGYSPFFLSFYRWLLGTRITSFLRLETIIQTQKYLEFADYMFCKREERMAAEKEEVVSSTRSSTRSDIFRHLLSTKLYSSLDLRADSSLLIAAGSDAIRLTIAATIFYWLKNPSVYETAASEILSVPSPEEITDAQLSSLHYLRACIDESMRLSPPKAGSLPREVLAGGIVVDGVYVPKGATVGVSVYALHHDPEIYPDPYAYRPERWLEGKEERRMKEAFCPFLKGPRACPGKTVAYFAIELALFHLVHRYDVRLSAADGKEEMMPKGLRWREDEYQFNDWILGFADGPIVELQERT